jgi:hypothetical protein
MKTKPCSKSNSSPATAGSGKSPSSEPGWVDPTVALPDDEITVLIRVKSDEWPLLMGWHEGECWYELSADPIDLPVTGWMHMEDAVKILDVAPRSANRNSELPNDIWKDPHVKAALKDGRAPEDIAVLPCPSCGRYGYYNQGSHFTCRFCRDTWLCLSEGAEPPADGRPWLRLDAEATLADTTTEPTEGYDNETRRAGNSNS